MRSELSKLSIISQVSIIEGCLLVGGVPPDYDYDYDYDCIQLIVVHMHCTTFLLPSVIFGIGSPVAKAIRNTLFSE